MSVVVDKVRPIIQEVVTSLGNALVDLEYVKEGRTWFLRVYADKEGGIDLDDCVVLSEHISAALDAMATDPFPDAYYLEVSSPGAERPLKTEAAIKAAIDHYVHLDYYVPLHGEKFHEGILKAVTEDAYVLEVQVKTRTNELQLPKDKVAKIRLAVRF